VFGVGKQQLNRHYENDPDLIVAIGERIMNVTKKNQSKMINSLYEVDQLIDEGANKSAKRIIQDIIYDLNEIERKYEKWRKKVK